jgi:hypothetical protein
MSPVGASFKTVDFGPWVLRVDAAQTRRCYRQMEVTEPGAAACHCEPCKNFALVQEEAYPAHVKQLFDELGIDRKQPFELSHYSRMPSGLHLYGGWHYFCGSVESGPTSLNTLHRVSATFEIGLTPVGGPRKPFPESACVQLAFLPKSRGSLMRRSRNSCLTAA